LNADAAGGSDIAEAARVGATAAPVGNKAGASALTPQTMRRVRQWHFYMGVFFAPMIIMFALSGALQTFRLQEEKGWGSQPPAWIETIASVHRDSKLPKAKPAAEASHEAAKPAVAKPRPPGPNKLPMQILMVVMSVALLMSALLGVMIALNNRQTRQRSLIMLAAGTIVPVALLLLA
jgi:uncharacterized iron-regulated membrane protein